MENSENNQDFEKGKALNENNHFDLNENLLEKEDLSVTALRNLEKKDAENAVPPDAWKNQQKAYNDAWENNKNQSLEDDV